MELVVIARLAAFKGADLGQARGPMQSIFLRKKMDARVEIQFERSRFGRPAAVPDQASQSSLEHT
jgi:hypothetical protein